MDRSFQRLALILCTPRPTSDHRLSIVAASDRRSTDGKNFEPLSDSNSSQRSTSARALRRQEYSVTPPIGNSHYTCSSPLHDNSPLVDLCIGWNDVTVICGHITIFTLWGNTAYCAKLSGEDLSRYSNKIESVGFEKMSVSSPPY